MFCVRCCRPSKPEILFGDFFEVRQQRLILDINFISMKSKGTRVNQFEGIEARILKFLKNDSPEYEGLVNSSCKFLCVIVTNIYVPDTLWDVIFSMQCIVFCGRL